MSSISSVNSSAALMYQMQQAAAAKQGATPTPRTQLNRSRRRPTTPTTMAIPTARAALIHRPSPKRNQPQYDDARRDRVRIKCRHAVFSALVLDHALSRSNAALQTDRHVWAQIPAAIASRL